MRTKEQVERDVEAEFATIDKEAKKAPPGVAGILEAYGRYDEAVKQLNEFFGALQAPPDFRTSNSSTS